MGDILSLIFSLVAVVGVIYAAYLFSRYVGGASGKAATTRYMSIVDKVSVGAERSLLIVKIGERHYLLGVASGGITMLTELDPDELDDIPPQAVPPDFKDILGGVLKKRDEGM